MSMIIKTVEFIKSSSKLNHCPGGDLPEFAFIGRSNVGKSSLINFLAGRKSLAKTSVSPGKTRLMNHYLINGSWYMVDLPGYGFASVGKKSRELFLKIISDYLLKRKQLICVFVLLDIRINPQQLDKNFLRWLGINEIPFVIIFTKTDKLNKSNLLRNKENYFNCLLESFSDLPTNFSTSTVQKTGREEILNYIRNLLDSRDSAEKN
jgi:GTP-binding protein